MKRWIAAFLMVLLLVLSLCSAPLSAWIGGLV